MHRTTGLAVLFLGLAIAPSSAVADDETQFWLTASAVTPVADEISATAMVSQRFREDARGGGIRLARGSLDWHASERIALGGGLTYIETAATHEWRTHQQVLLGFDRLTSRTQLEERLAEGAQRTQLRLRERLQLAEPVSPKDKLFGSVEWLYVLRQATVAVPARTDSWRFALALQHKLAKHLDGSAGYMLIWSPRSGAGDHVTHAPQVSLTLRR